MKSLFTLVLSGWVLLLPAQNNTSFVNPMIGTDGHGHTFPGATLPYGMVQLSPDTRIDGSWDGCSGYHYSDSVIYGFSHTHLNGTGCSDYGDIMLMPTMGDVSFDPKVYGSPFSHTTEKASAGYYEVRLEKHQIQVRFTASTRVGFHEYTFTQAGLANLILDLNHRDKLLYGEIRVVNNRTLEVLRRSEAWAKDQWVFARIEFDTPMSIARVEANRSQQNDFYTGTELKISLQKSVNAGDKIKVKVTLSPTSYEGARLNSSEITGWDFNQVQKNAEKAWEAELSKIQISTANSDQKTVFYTALYHTMMQPNIAQDLDGSYRGRDNRIHKAEGFTYYSVFSLWDTFRAAHPLYTLIDKKRTADYINTFIKQYEQGGRLPVWELASNETDCMIGYHAVSVIADAMAKGIQGFDYQKAFEASKHSAMLDHLGLEAYKKQGFIAMDDEHESVSKTLEYAYDDWCIAQMAKILGKSDDYQYFMKRAQAWKNVFDPNTGFMRPKKNGGWDKSFDPREINNNFTEGNSWQYSFFVPQDITGMIEAYGGNSKFEAKLDEMFNSESKTTGREQVDVTGLIGQYAHGNEPSHHMAYLYNFIGKPEKTKEKVHYILNTFYKNSPDGLIGNEDCGQMSAWYVLSALGMYAVTPGIPEWTQTQPLFSSATIQMEDGSRVTLTPETPKSRLGITTVPTNTQANFVTAPKIVPVPVIEAAHKAFKDQMQVTITAQHLSHKIFYLVTVKGADYSRVKRTFVPYVAPFTIDATSTVSAYVMEGTQTSQTIFASFFKKPNTYAIAINSTYNPQYHAGGPEGLLDGIHGTTNWRKGDWQGCQAQDFEAVVDLKETKSISTCKTFCLQDTRSWIVMPTQVAYYSSLDGVNFTLLGTLTHTVDPQDYENSIHDFALQLPKPIKARYLKVKAINFGKLPEWHIGAGGDAFIFVDEIEIN
ncbi:GH92 family glycosyl hydrolase [Flavobacterium sp.]|jgi:predicted alpha-1,2-mannosidase|uniref:GH92 family glycosyl hydrolase n=1 Tax=Flavobacterium sp. TaxID=239 RepID=UPI0022CAD5B4|nr:GH92 family glycosyl hydrolase [Flavobacterium sp.]MCZ8167567.1 GH92 family glycosyl hydrolase [Flavobacterium sp.]